MYTALLDIHSIIRWFVLISLIVALFRAYKGWFSDTAFLKSDNIIRIVTSTIAHVQLLVGIILYFVSPVISKFFSDFAGSMSNSEIRFFGLEHSIMMLLAVVFITIGSSKAKRKATDKAKFKTMAIWLTIALIIILIAIPWPFSPFAPSRPYF